MQNISTCCSFFHVFIFSLVRPMAGKAGFQNSRDLNGVYLEIKRQKLKKMIFTKPGFLYSLMLCCSCSIWNGNTAVWILGFVLGRHTSFSDDLSSNRKIKIWNIVYCIDVDPIFLQSSLTRNNRFVTSKDGRSWLLI